MPHVVILSELVILSEAKDLCTSRRTAQILRPTKNADLRMTSQTRRSAIRDPRPTLRGFRRV